MDTAVMLTAGMVGDLTPRMFLVNHAAGEKLADAIAAFLDPPVMAGIHYWELGREKTTALHYHERDEYWTWTKGRTRVTIRLPDGRRETFEIGPGWIVYCVRGVEHGHQPVEDWACFEWTGLARPGMRSGHLTRTSEPLNL